MWRAKQLLKAITSSNVATLRASLLVAKCIVKLEALYCLFFFLELFKTVAKGLILPATKDIYRELLGETSIEKLPCFLLSAST